MVGASPEVDSNQSSQGTRERLTDASSLKTHATLLVGLVVCGVAFWFELGRALGGNSLSWAYVFEWPLLAIFVVYMWWKILHPDASQHREAKPAKPAIAPEYEGMLAAWQEHQRQLEAARELDDAQGDGNAHGARGEPQP